MCKEKKSGRSGNILASFVQQTGKNSTEWASVVGKETWNVPMLLVRSHPSVWNTRQSNSSHNGESDTVLLFFSQNIRQSLLARSTSILQVCGVQTFKLESKCRHQHFPIGVNNSLNSRLNLLVDATLWLAGLLKAKTEVIYVFPLVFLFRSSFFSISNSLANKKYGNFSQTVQPKNTISGSRWISYHTFCFFTVCAETLLHHLPLRYLTRDKLKENKRIFLLVPGYPTL